MERCVHVFVCLLVCFVVSISEPALTPLVPTLLHPATSKVPFGITSLPPEVETSDDWQTLSLLPVIWMVFSDAYCGSRFAGYHTPAMHRTDEGVGFNVGSQ